MSATAIPLDEPGAPCAVTDPEHAVAEAIDAGDHRRALTLCARHYGAPLGRLCMALVGGQAEAEDLAQETLLCAHAAFDNWRREASLAAWLFGIARKRCARYLERSRSRTQSLRLAPEPTDPGTAEELAAQRQRAERARAELGRMKPTEREALLLRFGAELSFREVAEACGIEEATARKRVSRAIAHLRAELAPDSSDPSHRGKSI